MVPNMSERKWLLYNQWIQIQISTRAVEPASDAGSRAKNVQMVDPKPERAIWFLALQFEVGG